MQRTAAAGSGRAHARAITTIAKNYANEGHWEESRRWADLAVALAHHADSPDDLADALIIVGVVASEAGTLAETRVAFERCVAVSTDVARIGVGLNCRMMLASVAVQAGRRADAIAAADEVVRRADDGRDELAVRETYELLDSVAVVMINAHEEARAIALIDRAVALRDDAAAHRDPTVVFDNVAEAGFTLHRGFALLELGRNDEAAVLLRRAISEIEQSGSSMGEGTNSQAWLGLAEAARRTGHRDEAERALGALDLARLTPHNRAWRDVIVANLAIDRRDCTAELAAAEARGLARPDDAPDERGELAVVEARLAAAHNRRDDARRDYDRAIALFRESGFERRVSEITAERDAPPSPSWCATLRNRRD
jgi:tetratricopeptide (TPR) repeat protein